MFCTGHPETDGRRCRNQLFVPVQPAVRTRQHTGLRMRSVGLLQPPPPSSKPARTFHLALVSATALRLASPNLTPVWLPRRGKAHHHGAMLGGTRTSPEDPANDSPEENHRGSPPDLITPERRTDRGGNRIRPAVISQDSPKHGDTPDSWKLYLLTASINSSSSDTPSTPHRLLAVSSPHLLHVQTGGDITDSHVRNREGQEHGDSDEKPACRGREEFVSGGWRMEEGL
ncbi:hypothetical protein EYF80_044988 [Liparis tanakae]|uniref:Uncharacterized protein n=1 Tax=Liparis tanakae TaxID=230148 RepID=A0A4Z2FVH7_9TELE|nr:hypothetical protein EYF80_044988 [Liparis tanakae]